MQTGGRHLMCIRRTGGLRKRVGPATHSVRSPLHHRPAAQPAEGAQPVSRTIGVVQLLARQRGSAQEEMAVRVAHTQLPGGDVPENRADGGYHCR